jgi:hypothetical protein
MSAIAVPLEQETVIAGFPRTASTDSSDWSNLEGFLNTQATKTQLSRRHIDFVYRVLKKSLENRFYIGKEWPTFTWKASTFSGPRYFHDALEVGFSPIWEIKQNSTAASDIPGEVGLKMLSVLEAAKGEFFEDGMTSAFSRDLVDLIKEYKETAINFLLGLIAFEVVNDDVASEALRWVGYIEDPPTHEGRLWVLHHCLLNCSSPRVRDGALLGLASMDDPNSIPYVRKAIDKEQIGELRKSMEQVLAQLEATQSAATTEGN